MSKFIEWGENPEDGMVAVGFSCSAALEGIDLKKQILDLFKKGPSGVVEAVLLFKNKAMADKTQASNTIKQMYKDFQKDGVKSVLKKSYIYKIQRIFWAHEKDIPSDDPRYFRLNLIDMRKIDMSKYEIGNSFDINAFIKDHMDPEESQRISTLSKTFDIYETKKEND
ncbi:MAG: hypothetical protein ACOCV1_00870 [Bacillota bacterium]